jgi:hypothetical protein
LLGEAQADHGHRSQRGRLANALPNRWTGAGNEVLQDSRPELFTADYFDGHRRHRRLLPSHRSDEAAPADRG